MTRGAEALIASIPEALAVTENVCSSVNVASTKAGINMDAVNLMGRIVKATSLRTADRDSLGCAKLVVFSTSASGKSTHMKLRAVAEDCGVAVSGAFFHCPGAFMFLHKGRPNDADCQNAAAFAKAQLN